MFRRKFADEESVEKAVKQCSLFKGLANSELKAILKTAHIRDYSADERIFVEGTIGLCFYIIAKGSVEIVTQSPSDEVNPRVLKVHKEGAYFSEVHLFSETNHTVSCVAKELTKLIIFSKPDFEDLVKIKPKIGNKVLL
ncbi:MAG: cyclic nucleotide-binding domain-containing protein, partial [Ignavibacteria bacterium]